MQHEVKSLIDLTTGNKIKPSALSIVLCISLSNSLKNLLNSRESRSMPPQKQFFLNLLLYCTQYPNMLPFTIISCTGCWKALAYTADMMMQIPEVAWWNLNVKFLSQNMSFSSTKIYAMHAKTRYLATLISMMNVQVQADNIYFHTKTCSMCQNKLKTLRQKQTTSKTCNGKKMLIE